jgi:S1-C subfamily serine protease
MKYLATLVLSVVFASTAVSQETVKLARELQANSVTVHAAGGQGSGVVIKRGDTHYILTAAHVVARLRQEQTSYDPAKGSPTKRIAFNDAKIVTELYEGSESVGETALSAEMVRYSNADNGEDLALLRVRKKGVLNAGVKFYLGAETPAVGTDLLHVGSLLGQVGSNSVTTGIVSQLGRNLNNTIYDQSNCGAFPGSSGGGLFRRADGQYVGMIVRGAGETFNLYVPMRRIATWAERTGVKFIFDPTVTVPSIEDIKKKPVEEPGNGTLRSPSARGDD